MSDTNNSSNNESFESLLEQSLIKEDNFSIGDEVSGKIVFIAKENIFVDISGKSEAILDRKEFADDDGNLSVKTGDTIKAYIVSFQGGEIKLTRRIGRSTVSIELLEKARKFGIPVEGTVVATVNGGYTVSISGVECFCPYSQIDIKAPARPESVMNRSLPFKVTQITEKGRNIVVSRRAYLEERRAQAEKELRSTLKEGDPISGEVVSVQKFGVFVDIGGIEALLPRTEISWGRNADLGAFKPGDTVKAKIIGLDWEGKRIVISIRQTLPEPWEHISNYSTGQEVSGVITNIIKNGAFVELEPGLEGFIPVSRMSYTKRINRPEDAVQVGGRVNVRIMELHPDQKKISLELLTGESDPWQSSSEGFDDSIFSAVIEAVRPNGLNVRLPNGMSGFVPREQCAVKKGSDLQSVYSAGKEVKVAVKNIDRESKRLHLSEIEALRREERQEYEKFMNAGGPSGEDASAFGKLFKQKFEEIQNKKDPDKPQK